MKRRNISVSSVNVNVNVSGNGFGKEFGNKMEDIS